MTLQFAFQYSIYSFVLETSCRPCLYALSVPHLPSFPSPPPFSPLLFPLPKLGRRKTEADISLSFNLVQRERKRGGGEQRQRHFLAFVSCNITTVMAESGGRRRGQLLNGKNCSYVCHVLFTTQR